MNLKQYFIIQVDDDSDARTIVKDGTLDLAKKINLTPYAGASCLDEFEEVLKDSRALIYVIDGNFTKEPIGIKEFLAPEAVKKVQETDKNAYIILYSIGKGCEKMADNHHIFYVDKDINELTNTIEHIIKTSKIA
ncbi:Uncharacterised protein [Candidatus Tiddalikarchaeum anstoanum]|nr:Uncharacterised protein [Candidatus Tiddalikarchaeum anstoanum]